MAQMAQSERNIYGTYGTADRVACLFVLPWKWDTYGTYGTWPFV